MEWSGEDYWTSFKCCKRAWMTSPFAGPSFKCCKRAWTSKPFAGPSFKCCKRAWTSSPFACPFIVCELLFMQFFVSSYDLVIGLVFKQCSSHGKSLNCKEFLAKLSVLVSKTFLVDSIRIFQRCFMMWKRKLSKKIQNPMFIKETSCARKVGPLHVHNCNCKSSSRVTAISIN